MIRITSRVYNGTKEWQQRLFNFPKRMLQAGSVNVRNYLKEWWIKKDAAEPNKLNPSRRTHFWRTQSESIDAVNSNKKTGSVTLRFWDRRLAHKITGGRIVPIKAKALTIPIHPAAYAVRASFLSIVEGVKLFVLRSKRGNAFLAGKKNGVLIRYYLLRYSVDQKPWPGTLPPAETVMKQFIAGATTQMRPSP